MILQPLDVPFKKTTGGGLFLTWDARVVLSAGCMSAMMVPSSDLKEKDQ